MKFVKSLLLSLIGFLLFVSLSAFGFVLTVNSTLLNESFVTSEINKMDLAAISRNVAETILPPTFAQNRILGEAVVNTVKSQEGYLKLQANNAVIASYSYFLGKTEQLKLVVSLDQFKNSFKANLRQAFNQNLPPELAGANPAQVEQYFNQGFLAYTNSIPDSLDLVTLLQPDVKAQLASVRVYITYVRTGFYLLIALMLLLILLTWLLDRNLPGFARGLGTIFLSYGIVEYIGIILMNNFDPGSLASGLPASLDVFLRTLMRDVMAPLQTFSLVISILGLALVVFSFVYKPRPAETPPATSPK